MPAHNLEKKVLSNQKELSKRYMRGWKLLWNRDVLVEAVIEVPLTSQMTFRDHSEEINVPTSTLRQIS